MAQTEFELVMNILNANHEKPFVKRILNPGGYPNIKNKDGSISTHRMEWSEVDGKNIVYPTIEFDASKKKLIDYGENAFNEAIKTGNFIEMPTPEDADWFSKRYKAVWGK